MRKSTFQRRLMEDYVLGRLQAPERERLEEEYFADDELFGQLLTIYDEIIDRYWTGQLHVEDRKLFEERYLEGARGTGQLEFEKLLRARLPLSEGVLRGRVQSRHPIATFHRLAEMLRVARWRVAAVAAAAILIAAMVGVGSWIIRPAKFDETAFADLNFIYRTETIGGEGRRELRTRGAKQVPVQHELVLTSRDSYAIEIRPERAIYLYALQWDTSGSVAVLFPNPKITDFTNPLEPGRSYRIPPSPTWLHLDEVSGLETVAVGASPGHWEEMEGNLRQLVDGSPEERRAATDVIKRLIAETEATSEGRHFVKSFSFRHSP